MLRHLSDPKAINYCFTVELARLPRSSDAGPSPATRKTRWMDGEHPEGGRQLELPSTLAMEQSGV